MPITPSDYEHFSQINASKGVASFYALDQAGANVDLFGFGPDLEIADPSMWTDNPEWLTGDGVSDYAGFHSDGSPTQEDQAEKIFKLNNGLQLIAFQVAYSSAPVSDEEFVFLGGQDLSAPSSARGVKYTLGTDGNVDQNSIVDGGGARNIPGYNATVLGNEMTIVFVNDARSGITENGTGKATAYSGPNSNGLDLVSANGISKVFANYYGQNDFGNILGFPSGMSSGVGVGIGARWNNFDSTWDDNTPFQIRRLLVMNFKKVDPRLLGEIAFDLLYSGGLPGASVYRGILNA